MRRLLKAIFGLLLVPGFLLLALLVCSASRMKGEPKGRPRLFWGSVPIINNSYWARAMLKAGYRSETFTTDFYSSINTRGDWDRLLSEEYAAWPKAMRPFLGFLRVMLDYDILFISCQGVFIGTSPLWRLQAPLLRLAGKKIVVIPFGADAYVYRAIRLPALTHGLLMSYPDMARRQSRVADQVDYWCRHANLMIPGFIGPDGVGRWDVVIGSQLFIDLATWQKRKALQFADGRSSPVVICHAPNHRGFKGTEFVIEAIQRLRDEGLQVELRLLEKLQTSEVRRVLCEEADILLEQLVVTGHGLNGLEGMASGLPVISNLEDEAQLMPFRRWSYFGECPIASASPENLVDVLRKLVTRPELRRQLGDAGRAYVEKYHGLDSAVHLFSEVVECIYGRRDTLINMYHPLLGEYPKRLPKISHPLVNNRIVD
ncbi:aminotransferase [Alphaproteobacteria bacterium]|nr:aminotransferase [Alphaproteobacteria bacterium]